GLYLSLAKNIIQHFCYSADPNCAPAWERQPPGFPLFIAFVSLIAGPSSQQIVQFQTLTFGGAILYLLYSARKLFEARNLGGAVLLSISPLTIAWSRYILTETISAAAALYVLAECMRSLEKRKLRTVGIGVSAGMAILVKWDLITLFALVLPIALYLHPLR